MRRLDAALPQISSREVSRLVKEWVLSGKKGWVPPGWKRMPMSSVKSMASIC